MFNNDVISKRFGKINFKFIFIILVIILSPLITQSADVTIDKISIGMLGNQAEVSINIDNIPIGTEYSGFDFLIAFDSRNLGLTSVEPGEFISIENLEWEYFSYRLEFDVDCNSSDCPQALIHIFGLHSFDWQNPSGGPYINVIGELVKLNFIITHNRSIECKFLPISFYWQSCQNNTLSNSSNNVPDISNLVFDAYGADITLAQELPSWTGASNQCQVSGIDRKIDFYNGGIGISCLDQLCAGDLNVNNVPFEIGDLVLYGNYFTYGIIVFSFIIEWQIAESDVNCDGISLSVSDLVFLHKIITRDTVSACCGFK